MQDFVERVFDLNQTYYIGDSSSLYGYRGVEVKKDGCDQHVFQCVEFDCDDIYREFDVTGSLEAIKSSKGYSQ